MSKEFIKNTFYIVIFGCVVGSTLHFKEKNEQYLMDIKIKKSIQEEKKIWEEKKKKHKKQLEDELIKLNNEKLSYATNLKWEWFNKSNNIQKNNSNNLNRSIFRTVNFKDKYTVIVYKQDDLLTTFLITFVMPCKKNNKIETNKKFSDGNSKFLTCNDFGYTYGFTLSDEEISLFKNNRLEENLNGFKYSIDINDYDLDMLSREVSILNSDK